MKTSKNVNTNTTTANETLAFHCYYVQLRDPKRKTPVKTERVDARTEGALEQANNKGAELLKLAKNAQTVVVVDYKKYRTAEGAYRTVCTDVNTLAPTPKAKPAPKGAAPKSDELNELKELVAAQSKQIAALLAALGCK